MLRFAHRGFLHGSAIVGYAGWNKCLLAPSCRDHHEGFRIADLAAIANQGKQDSTEWYRSFAICILLWISFIGARRVARGRFEFLLPAAAVLLAAL